MRLARIWPVGAGRGSRRRRSYPPAQTAYVEQAAMAREMYQAVTQLVFCESIAEEVFEVQDDGTVLIHDERPQSDRAPMGRSRNTLSRSGFTVRRSSPTGSDKARPLVATRSVQCDPSPPAELEPFRRI